MTNKTTKLLLLALALTASSMAMENASTEPSYSHKNSPSTQHSLSDQTVDPKEKAEIDDLWGFYVNAFNDLNPQYDAEEQNKSFQKGIKKLDSLNQKHYRFNLIDLNQYSFDFLLSIQSSDLKENDFCLIMEGALQLLDL